MIIKSILSGSLILFISAGIVNTSYAGAWTAPRNTIYDKLSFNYYRSVKNFNSNGDRVDNDDNGEFTDYNITNYFEYGIIDSLTAITSLTYKWLKNETDLKRYKAYGLGDVDLALRYRFLDTIAGVLSAQLLGKIPGGYSKNDPLPLGNGQFDLELKVLYGRSLYPILPGYFNIEVGYRWRFGDPADEIRYLLEVGTDIYKGLYGRVKLDGIGTIYNGVRKTSSGNPTSMNNYDLGKLDMTLGYKFSDLWGIELGYVPQLYGRNTAAGFTCSVGVWLKTS